MSAASTSTEPDASRGRVNRLIAGFLVLTTVIAFWPVTRWMAGEVAARQQIRQAFVLLGAGVGLVAWQHWGEWRLRLDASNRALLLMTASYACVAGAWSWNLPLLVLPGFVFALAGCLHLLVGVEAWRFVKPLFIGFIACLVIILAFPLLDWPLRQMAGVNAARLLHSLGFTPQLSVVLEPAPKLLLSTGRNVFIVATECNGFGLITSSIVLVLLAAGISGRRALALLWLVPVAALTGFTFNLLRILVICLLAPSFPQHYHALHETVGTLMLWCGLGLAGWLAWKPITPEKSTAQP